MASTTYEEVLRSAQQLTPKEQRRLRGELEGEAITPQPEAVPDEIRRLREQIALRARTTPEERATAHATLDHAAAVVGAAWKSDKSALEAVQEQRRDL